MISASADLLFEASWEVCNKVGGIFTVVKSKIVFMQKFYKENYILVGPYFPDKAKDFREKICPPDLKEIFEELRNEGINCHFGNWMVAGNPKTVLIDFNKFASKDNDIKKEFWEKYKIDTLGTEYHDFDEPMVWAVAVGKLIEKFALKNPDKKIAAHFHEWMAGAAIPYLKIKKCKVATTFTTHATMLGRTLAGNNIDLYSMLDNIDPEEEARKFGVTAKFLMEKVCANISDAFTTVSEITGLEAEKILGKKPDVLVLNGLDIMGFPSIEDASIKHKHFKNKVYEFFLSYFFPYYSFDLSKTLIYFIFGRYELKNKGIDMMIEALAKLNQKLKDAHSDKTVVAFFFIPGNARAIRPEIVESRILYDDIKDFVDENMDDIKNKMLYNMIGNKDLSVNMKILKESQEEELKRRIHRLKREGNPPLSTHEYYDENNDAILNLFKKNSLLNKKDDKVKVIAYPIYLSGADGLLNTDYYETIMAGHLGIFPSYYEPWGYTPLESAALGVAAVTTDLAGFGRYIKPKLPKGPDKGIFVIERYNKNYDESVNQLFKVMEYYAGLDKKQRIKNKIEARNLASLADWKILVEYYIKAHNIAVERVFQ